MDNWIQKLSLAVLLVVIGLCLSGTNREISCYTPAQFTDDHSRYAHQVCSKPDAVTTQVRMDTITPDTDGNVTLWTSHISPKSARLLKLVLMEVILVCTTYCVIEWIVAAGRVDAQFPHKELHKSYFKVPLYFLIQLVCAICWAAFTIVSNRENEFSAAQSTFMCEFEVNKRDLYPYTVQCIDDRDHLTRAAYMINFGLALLVTLTKLIHIVSALLIGPFLGFKGARAALMKSGVIHNPGELGAGFTLSDLYFMMLTSGKGSAPHRSNVGFGASNEAQGGRGKDTELGLLVGSE